MGGAPGTNGEQSGATNTRDAISLIVRTQHFSIDPLKINDFKRTALHLTLMCRGRDTKRLQVCVASHLIAPRISPCGIRTASQAGYAMCGFLRPHVGHSKAEYAMCVALDPHVGHHDSFASLIRHVRRFMSPCGTSQNMRAIAPPQEGRNSAVSALCVGSHTNDPCVFPSGKNMVSNAPSAARMRGVREGEHAPAAVVNAGRGHAGPC